MASAGTGVGERAELPSVVLVEGFGVVNEALAERRLEPGAPWKIGAALVLLVVAIGLIISLLAGDDPVTVAEPTTTLAPPTTRAPVRTTLPTPVASAEGVVLPGVRPQARLIAAVEGDIYQLDLVTGRGAVSAVEPTVDQLFELDGVLVIRSDRELLRLDPDGTVRLLADGVSELVSGHGPASVVSIVRDGDGVVARILGPDGVFRAGARLPGEAIVHGSVQDRLIVGLAGSVVATTGAADPDATIVIGSGRVLALSDTTVTRLVCAVDGCLVVTSSLLGDVLLEVPLPEPLASAAPERWSNLGSLSPDGTRLVIRLQHGNGSVHGAVMVDLVTGVGRHSPELGVNFGVPAWAPDSRFVLYPFDGDVMIWDVEALDGQLPSARASIRLNLTDLTLR